jgi:hypothetical protein
VLVLLARAPNVCTAELYPAGAVPASKGHRPAATQPAGADWNEIEKARQRFPPSVTRAVLKGEIAAPPGFARAFAERLGPKRLDLLRAGTDEVSGSDNDIAAVCLARLSVTPDSLKAPSAPPGRPRDRARSSRAAVKFIRSEYPVASGKTSGFFQTGQDADIMLSGIGFNQTGGPLLFNHPMGIASDGRRLLLADTYNNRVLIWNKLPQSNTPPDRMLGQKDFAQNNPGRARDLFNWPVNVATDGQRIVVADTENHRLLIWTRWPTNHGAPADLVIQGVEPGSGIDVGQRRFSSRGIRPT